MKSILAIAATTLGLGLLAPNAQAALITGITASSTLGASNGTNIINTVNGQGLPGNVPSLTGNHVTNSVPSLWAGDSSVTTGIINFNLNGTYALAGFSFWNFNFSSGTSSLGIRNVTVQTSTDGVSYSNVVGAPSSFAQANGSVPEPAQVFSFLPVTASYVRFVVGSNWGDTFTGFSEVQFDSAPAATTPEPASILGLLAVGGGLLVTNRRKG